MYGPLNTVVPAQTAANWIGRLLEFGAESVPFVFALMQIARHTGDRYRDVPEESRSSVIKWLKSRAAPRHYVKLVREGGELHTDEQEMLFGESLPAGLRLV